MSTSDDPTPIPESDQIPSELDLGEPEDTIAGPGSDDDGDDD
jgi:hypothetical protein